MARLRIGSRGSRLALWQAQHVADLLQLKGHLCEITIIRTSGDTSLGNATQSGVPVPGWAGKGMFTREIEEALLAGAIDLAVHSLKDLPTELPAGLTLGAILKREESQAHDVLLSERFADLAALPAGARVGTSSLRRQAQLKALRNDLDVVPLRGNVDTRLRKLQAAELDAIVLAAAGIERLGLRAQFQRTFRTEEMCPAAGQGALAVEICNGKREVAEAVAALSDSATRRLVECERALLASLGGGCQVPIGAHAQPGADGSTVLLHAVVAQPDGSKILRASGQGSDAVALSSEVAARLCAQDAKKILKAANAQAIASPGEA